MNIRRTAGISGFTIMCLIALACTPKGGGQGFSDSSNAEALDTVPVVEEHDISLLFAGDLMQHQGQINAAARGKGVYDYTDCFRYIKSEVSQADVAIANFEVTLGGAPYTGYPCFSAPDAYLNASLDAGFDVMLTANNHCCDRRKDGLLRTIQVMDSLHVPHLGTYVSQQEHDKSHPYLLEKNGFRIALLNYTYATNGIPVPEGTVVNLLDTVQMKRDIQKAKAMKPDAIIAFPHWGIEYTLTPPREEVVMADWLFNQGVDHVIGGHPHVVQPIEVRTDAQGRRHLLVYSLGNYVSNMTKADCVGGLMVKMNLHKKGDEVDMSHCSYSLVWVSRPNMSGKQAHRIYPANYPNAKLNATERSVRDKFLRNARNLFQKYNIGIEEEK